MASFLQDAFIVQSMENGDEIATWIDTYLVQNSFNHAVVRYFDYPDGMGFEAAAHSAFNDEDPTSYIFLRYVPEGFEDD